MSQVSLGRPEFAPGTPPGHPDRQIPLCDFLYRFFSPYCLGINYGLLIPTSQFQKYFLIIKYGIDLADFNV